MGEGAAGAHGGDGATAGSPAVGGHGFGLGSGEDCTNLVDDDEDGLVDCNDSDCGDFQCLAPQRGALAYGIRIASGDACPPPLTKEELFDCSACACDAASGTCDIHWDAYTAAPCDQLLGTADGPVCLDNNDGNRAFVASWFETSAPSCSPAPGPTFPAESSSLCAWTAAAGACPSGGACVPGLPAGKVCALIDAAATCDSPYVRVAIVYEAQGDDTCSCGCTAGAQSCEGAVIKAYSGNNSCTGNVVEVPADGQCHDAGNTHSIGAETFPLSAACAPNGTLASASPSDARTLCCVP